ncbi:hypothetical protein LQZ21_07735 [Treponema sp. TIM-1]|uniref:hypothetical protein n=1 Tax=Treponema sp. TIM-1 TaxID=2898417 RepID=UPI00397FF36C
MRRNKTRGKRGFSPTSVFAAIIAGLVVLCSGCSSLVNLGGRALDGSAFREKTLARYRGPAEEGLGQVEVREVRGKTGGSSLIISSGAMPALVFRGSIPEAGEFHLISLGFLASHTTGWNEFTRELSGRGVFRVEGDQATLRLERPVDPLDISEGKIRQKDTRLIGEQALRALRNREERIAVLVQWMHSREAVPVFAGQKSFERYWKPILFPELVSRKKRPPAWSEAGAVWTRAEDIRWNTSYTGILFPEELRMVRNSGTLLRDWEEAAAWIYLEYEWDRMIALWGEEIQLIKVK